MFCLQRSKSILTDSHIFSLFFSFLFFLREREGQKLIKSTYLNTLIIYIIHSHGIVHCIYSPFNSVFDPFFFWVPYVGACLGREKTKRYTMTSASSWGLQLFFWNFVIVKMLTIASCRYIKTRGRISPGQNWSINKTKQKKNAVYFFLAYLTEL